MVMAAATGWDAERDIQFQDRIPMSSTPGWKSMIGPYGKRPLCRVHIFITAL